MVLFPPEESPCRTFLCLDPSLQGDRRLGPGCPTYPGTRRRPITTDVPAVQIRTCAVHSQEMRRPKAIHLQRDSPPLSVARISEVFAVSTGTLPLNDNASRRFRQRTLVVMLTTYPVDFKNFAYGYSNNYLPIGLSSCDNVDPV